MDTLWGERTLLVESETNRPVGSSSNTGPLSVQDPEHLGKFKAARDLEDALPPADFLQRVDSVPLPAALVHSCAVVGYGKGLGGARLRARVDGHHLVARLNNAPSDGYDEHVGSVTTLRVTDGVWEGFRERGRGETVIAAAWCPGGAPCPREALRRLGRKKTHALNPHFLEYIKRGLITSGGDARKSRGTSGSVPYVPSPAFITVMLLLQVCHPKP
jgi:hypothetical protein